jgi:hypothetical protein
MPKIHFACCCVDWAYTTYISTDCKEISPSSESTAENGQPPTMHMRRFRRAYERILKEGQRPRARRRPRWRQRKLSTNDPQETLRRPAIYRVRFSPVGSTRIEMQPLLRCEYGRYRDAVSQGCYISVLTVISPGLKVLFERVGKSEVINRPDFSRLGAGMGRSSPAITLAERIAYGWPMPYTQDSCAICQSKSFSVRRYHDGS